MRTENADGRTGYWLLAVLRESVVDEPHECVVAGDAVVVGRPTVEVDPEEWQRNAIVGGAQFDLDGRLLC